RKQPRARGTKAKYRVEAFEGIKETASKKLGQDKVELHAEGRRLGGKIMELKDVSHAYDDVTILNKFNYTFKKNDRIGIVGKNGAGKTTFLNILTGKQLPNTGTTDKGVNTMFGYYTQEDFTFDDSQKVIEAVKEVAEVHPGPDGTIITASQLLTRFLFPPEKQYQIIGKLSGGEKRRLQLLLILAKNPNFLILDEPTNDLDITTLNVLEDFLEGFPGCLMVVSHDRYFLDRTTDHLFVFEGGGVIHDFPGNYTDFREQQAEKAAKLEKPAPKEKPKEVVKPTEKKALSYKEKRELEGIEAELKQLEEKKKGFILKLNGGNGSHEELTEWASKIEEIDTLLEEKELRWLELSELNA
ncbi:MAG: ATP-binding cassette domain-containing protein, partial [Imperialibacter sp.]